MDGVVGKLNGLSSQTDTPLIRWSILGISVIAVWVWLIEPLQVWNEELSVQVDRNAEKVARLLTLEQNASQWLEAQREVNQRRVAMEKQLFVSASDTQAQAQLQSLLQQMAGERKLTIESQKLIPSEPMPPVGHKLAVELGVRGELIDVLYFMNDVSKAEKLLVIDQWIVQIDRLGRAYVRCTLAGIRPVQFEATDDE